MSRPVEQKPNANSIGISAVRNWMLDAQDLAVDGLQLLRVQLRQIHYDWQPALLPHNLVDSFLRRVNVSS